MSESIGYEADKCHFRFPGCKKTHAGYSRAEDSNKTPWRGPFFDACQNCVSVSYPKQEQPEQLRKGETDVPALV